MSGPKGEQHKHRANDKAQLNSQKNNWPIIETGVETLVVTALLIFGYMFAIDPVHRKTAVWLFFAAYVALGFFIALRLVRSFSEDAAPNAAPHTAGTLRPYVSLLHTMPFLENISAPQHTKLVDIVFENSGKEPAYDVMPQSHAFIAFTKLSEAPKIPPATTKSGGGAFLGPDRQITHTLGSSGSADPNLKAKIEREEVFLYVFGVVTYVNKIDGKTHKTEFCGLYIPQQGNFEQTPFGNDRD